MAITEDNVPDESGEIPAVPEKLTDAQLIELGRAAQNGGKPPVVNERPEWVPEEFFNAETGAVDYSAIAAALNAKKEAVPEPTTPEANETAAPETAVNPLDGVLSEFAAKGQLSDETYKALLEKNNLPREIVDRFIEGEQLRMARGEEQVLAAVGGREAFNAMRTWAAKSLTQAERSAFDAQVGLSPESAGIALQWLKARYEDANGSAPSLVSGRPATTQATGFASREEMVAAMSDKRYGKDAAYDRMVAQKVAQRQFKL